MAIIFQLPSTHTIRGAGGLLPHNEFKGSLLLCIRHICVVHNHIWVEEQVRVSDYGESGIRFGGIVRNMHIVLFPLSEIPAHRLPSRLLFHFSDTDNGLMLHYRGDSVLCEVWGSKGDNGESDV